MYFRQFWQDPRLSFERKPGLDKLVVGAEYIKLIWVPDTFFVNEKTAYFHAATTDNQFVRIFHTGDILRSIRWVPTEVASKRGNYSVVIEASKGVTAESTPAVPLPGLKRSVQCAFIRRELLISAFLTGLHSGHVLSTVLARQKTGVWKTAKPGKSCGRSRVHPSDLDSRHVFCQWKNCLLPRSHNRKSILANPPWRKGSAEHSVSPTVSKAPCFHVSLRAATASFSSMKPPSLMFRCLVCHSLESPLHHQELRLSVCPPWDTLSPLSPQNDCFGCCRQIRDVGGHTHIETISFSRLTITASCPMDLQYFPMDSQLCYIEIESCKFPSHLKCFLTCLMILVGYTMSDIRYKWNDGLNSVQVSGDVSLPQFKVITENISVYNKTSGTEKWWILF